jgi:glycosyltransferase involved in cell wall biosynthesis
MHHAPFCVDNSAFVQSTLNSRLLRKEKRQALGIDEKDIVVLFASKLTHRKRATDLLSAFSKLVRDCPSLWVVVAGTGEEGDKLRQQARAAGLEEKVKFVGFINQSGLPALYAMSDVFALPAEDEPWGLVINEVMAAGLPVIVSNGVGAAADLVQGQGTGIIYSMGDVAALADAIARLVKDADLRRNMGVRASALIARWDVEACVEGIARAIRKIRPSMECS